MTSDAKVPLPVGDQFPARRRAGNEPARHQEGGGVSGLEDKEIGCTDGVPKRPSGNHAVRNSAHGASRAGKFRQIEVARALKAAQKAKVPIAYVKIEPDGSILLIPGQPPTVPSSPSPNPWDGEP
jgi:hypothetical protein